MPQDASHEVTNLLAQWRAGDKGAYDRLFALMHGEIHRLAAHYMTGERPGHVLQPTALVNEAYLRLMAIQQVSWQDRAHFVAVAARVMRRVLVEHARAHRSQKRGGDVDRVSLEDAAGAPVQADPDLIALDEALAALAAVDTRKCRVVEMKVFGGLALDEMAAVLGVSPATVQRDWRMAKVWLLREMDRR